MQTPNAGGDEWPLRLLRRYNIDYKRWSMMMHYDLNFRTTDLADKVALVYAEDQMFADSEIARIPEALGVAPKYIAGRSHLTVLPKVRIEDYI